MSAPTQKAFFARTLQDHDPNPGRLLGLVDCPFEFTQHLRVQGVEFLRPVQDHARDRRLQLQLDFWFVAHRSSPFFSRSTSRSAARYTSASRVKVGLMPGQVGKAAPLKT